MERAAGQLELMDGPVPRRELARNLDDIAFANRWLGGIGPLRRELQRRDARSLLDVGTGSADVPRALATDAARRGVRLSVTCVDHSEQMLAIARDRTPAAWAWTFVCAEAGALPFPDGAFDAAISSLTLHHCEPPQAIALLRELRRVARDAPLVCDLVRSRAAWAGTWAYARLARSPLTRHDAPLSVRRAYTAHEAVDLARAAGWRAPRVRSEPFFRMLLLDG